MSKSIYMEIPDELPELLGSEDETAKEADDGEIQAKI